MGWLYTRILKRKKIQTIAVIVLVVCLLFLSYQVLIIYKLNLEQLTSANKVKLKSNEIKTNTVKIEKREDAVLSTLLLRGVLFSDISKYIPNPKGNFVCFQDKFEIIYSKINDDYCDCPLDGSDEPGTNACQNGKFYCSYQSPSNPKPAFIPSSRVNDGICDCCDGSDEWNGFKLDRRILEREQKRLGRYISPCTNYCK